ncbi:Bcr/CflA family efflux MFS transporter [Pseudovibrio sp. Tun.PSC04-5.I4]|uniref:Bcr/CflA family efflux MFS transporter n=1 Tax=Pseudovibrio sp. Tun.PSC04-5.I4 TaxID=1798213 RepID=UPI0008909002|nr:Bcr/CflA family efflux MFS transporter [Pseudovibrio sp. Tun.PSC04-5.I4]SDR33502.1 MFS transporter, DHA1 family, bicyclomycin/chloramphenicol resistance protein [Pseudovibrio sp. Tun.PSC04-5.I4]
MQNKAVFVAIYGAVFMLAPFAIDMYLPALPTIASDLQTGINELEATVAILLFGYALGQLLLGPLSVALGRRTVLLGGLGLFVVSSVLAGTAQSIEMLYVYRLLQAIGGAGSVVVFPSVRSRFGEKQSSVIISYIMALTVVAPLIAPVIGGYVLALAGWSAIFMVLAAFGGITLAVAVVLLPPEQEDKRGFSLRGVVSGYLSVLSEWRILAFIFSGAFAFAGLFVFVSGSPFVYITYFGVSPQNYGYLVGVNAAAMIGTNLLNARVLQRVAPVPKIFAGTLLLVVAGAALVSFAQYGLGLPWIVAGVVVFVGALGLTATNAIVGALSVRPEDNGTVSALNGAIQFGVGGLASFVVSLLDSTDATTMTTIMLGTSVAAALFALPLSVAYAKQRREISVEPA